MQTTVKMKFQLIERIVLSLCFLAAIALFTAHHSGSLADTGHSDAGCCLCLAHQASGTGANPSGSVLVTTSASAAGDDAVDLRARAYFGLGESAEALGQADKAARHFLSVAVLFDDPVVTPEALRLAADSLRKLGRAAEADKALAELKTRYPAP